MTNILIMYELHTYNLLLYSTCDSFSFVDDESENGL